MPQHAQNLQTQSITGGLVELAETIKSQYRIHGLIVDLRAIHAV
jgi:hypothetical protein